MSKNTTKPAAGCLICGFPTATPTQLCSTLCASKHHRGRRLIRPRGDAEFESSEGKHGQPQTLNLAEV